MLSEEREEKLNALVALKTPYSIFIVSRQSENVVYVLFGELTAEQRLQLSGSAPRNASDGEILAFLALLDPERYREKLFTMLNCHFEYLDVLSECAFRFATAKNEPVKEFLVEGLPPQFICYVNDM